MRSRKVKDQISTIRKSLCPSNELLDKLLSVPFLQDRIPSIKQQETIDGKNDVLLTALQEVPEHLIDSVMDGVDAALRESGQKHVANILRKESDEVPMSKERRQLLNSKLPHLSESVEAKYHLTDYLVADEVLTSSEREAILNNKQQVDMIRQLVTILERKSADSFEKFIDALKKTEQHHVVFILTGEGDREPLREECRKILRKERLLFVKNIIPSEIMSPLISQGVFTSYDQQRVESEASDNGKVEVMLDLLERKSQKDFDSFTDTLQRFGHEHVGQELMGPKVASEIKTQVEEGVDMVDTETIMRGVEFALKNDNREARQLKATLAKNGISVEHVRRESIVVEFRCKNLESLASLQRLYNTKQLEQLLNEAFKPTLADKGLKYLRIHIPQEEFQRCYRLKLMTPEHREALLTSAKRLVGKVIINEYLLSELSLSKRLKQTIERAGSPKQQVETLLNFVSRRPDTAFTQLLDALKATKQCEAMDIITADHRQADISNTDAGESSQKTKSMGNCSKMDEESEPDERHRAIPTMFQSAKELNEDSRQVSLLQALQVHVGIMRPMSVMFSQSVESVKQIVEQMGDRAVSAGWQSEEVEDFCLQCNGKRGPTEDIGESSPMKKLRQANGSTGAESMLRTAPA